MKFKYNRQDDVIAIFQMLMNISRLGKAGKKRHLLKLTEIRESQIQVLLSEESREYR